MKTSLLSIFLATTVITSANATDPQKAVDAFVSRCLKDGPRFDATRALAKQNEWPSLAGDLAMAFTPVESPDAIEGWLIGDEDGGELEALVVFSADVSGKKVEGCTLALSGVDAIGFDRSLGEAAKLTRAGEEVRQDSVYKRYSASFAGRETAVTLTIPRYPKGSDQVIASAVAEQVFEN